VVPAGDRVTSAVTVVVATRDRRTELLGTLAHHPPPVIVVDNGSRDGTPEAVAAAFPDVEVLRLPGNRGAAARNAGADRARTRYLAFADDDSYWEGSSLARAAAVLDAAPGTALLSARVLVGREGRLDPISVEMARAPLGTPAGAPGPAILGFLACAVVVRRDAFLAAGGFSPLLHVYGEEALLAMDLAAAGWSLSYVEELAVRHLPSTTARNPAARRRREARNRVLTALLRRPMAHAGRTVWAELGDRDRRRGALGALASLPAVLRDRTLLPPAVEADLRALE
jgi:N-acetylglucosaminyl-diphospho-decaprenol L-rhamnosyltransferase